MMVRKTTMQGHEGWDDYAPFYDWENAQTLGKRDVPFWRRLAQGVNGPVLELGCGTGRVTFPLARDGIAMVGVDRSGEMLQRAMARRRRLRKQQTIHLVRGDIRYLPFPERSFPLVLAPYGILQSLLDDGDLRATLEAVKRVLTPGGMFGLELVADLPAWREYSNRVTLRGQRPNGARISLTESVRQDRKRKLTLFDQQYVERLGRQITRKHFTLTFRTLTVAEMASRLDEAGLAIDSLLGDYQGTPWDIRAEAWIILARRPGRERRKTAQTAHPQGRRRKRIG
jgi:ubiquinone/menaquinone biosynthesis C-methylase UbiE